MSIQLFVQLTLNGLTTGVVYVLVSTGFALIYGTARVLNFAHGHFYMLGAFIYGGLIFLGLPWPICIVGAGLGVAILGTLTWYGFFRPLYGDTFLTVTASIGLGLIMVNGIIVTVGERDVIVPTIFPGLLKIGNITMPIEKIAIVGITLLIMLGLYYFLRTKTGKALEATTIDEEAAALQGINPGRVFLVAMCLGSGLAGIAGAVMVPTLSAQAAMGGPLTIIFLCVVVLAGHGSIKGAIIIGVLFGLVKSFGYHYFGSMDNILLFVAVGIIIYFRPWGLFGVEFKRTT